MPLTPCLRCGRLVRGGSYCPEHQPAKRPSPSSANRPSAAVRRRAKERAGDRCEDCGRAPTEANPLEVDHVLPVSEGGGHGPGNTRVRCLRCHRAKTRRDDAKRRRGRR